MLFLGIIPARYASTRFPGKPLALVHGRPMVQHVYERASWVIPEVWVATDDERILRTVESFGGKAVLTGAHHRSGTERCEEAMRIVSLRLNRNFDVVINIQGDEPFIHGRQLRQVMECFNDEKTDIATLVKRIDNKDDLFNPNIPKVIVNRQWQAMYFSRSVIPYLRDVPQDEWIKHKLWLKHIGLYAYRSRVLKLLTALPPAPPEQAESLEQLRWLWHGYSIRVTETDIENMAVDTPEDLDRINRMEFPEFEG